LRYDSDTTAVSIHNGDAPHLALAHHSLDSRYLVVFATALRRRSHHFAHFGIGLHSLRDRTNREIAVGDDSDDPARFNHRNTSAVVLSHHFRDGLNALVRRAAAGTRRH
jgi:hypothetical protein